MAMNSNVTNLVQESGFIPYIHRPETYIVSGLFLIILIVGVFGNGMMMITLGADSTAKNTSTIYMFSLALGDILVILTSVPFTSVIFTFDSWPWGQTVCKLSECVKDISVGVSVFTLTALSVERYYAVVNPLRRYVAGMKAVPLAVLIACLIWVLAIVLSMPAALFSHVMDIDITTNSSVHICNPFPVEFGASYRRGMVLFKFLAYYVIPLFIIAGYYFQIARHLQLSNRNMPCEMSAMQRQEQIRSRRKVGKMVISIVLIFFICFLPYHIFMIWFHFFASTLKDYNKYWHIFRIIGFCMTFINSCVNPLVLYFASTTFRVRFNRYICCFLKKRRSSVCQAGTSSDGNRRMKFSQRKRMVRRRKFKETSFSSTSRRNTQELNATAPRELKSTEDTRPT